VFLYDDSYNQPFSRCIILPALVKRISGKPETFSASTRSGSAQASTATHCRKYMHSKNLERSLKRKLPRELLKGCCNELYTLGDGRLCSQNISIALVSSALAISFSRGLQEWTSCFVKLTWINGSSINSRPIH
jgi:hypothetical protein